MDQRNYFALLGAYNEWANRRLIDGLAAMTDADWHADHGLFFRSIHMTFNHNLVVEKLWLGRIKGVPHGIRSLDEPLATARPALVDLLLAQNAVTLQVMREVPDPPPPRIRYTTTDGAPMDVPLAPVLGHVFNHATHHRGQITAVAHRLGVLVQELDIPYFLADARL